MTYVREQTSAELAAHMRSLQAMPGWFDPLADRLWEEVQSLQRDNAALMEDAAQIQIARGGAVERAAGLEELCFKQSIELLGVITDIEQFGLGFDDVCFDTVKRAYAALAQKEQ